MSQNEVANVERGVAEANEGIATLHDQLGEIDRGIGERLRDERRESEAALREATRELQGAIKGCGEKIAAVEGQFRDQIREGRDRRMTYWSYAYLVVIGACFAVEVFIAGTRA